MNQKNSRVENAGTKPVAAKSIILFSDGTGNSSAKLFKTNVWRLYEAVDLGPAPADEQRQIAYYDDGIGTHAFKPLRILQGIFGWGLRDNVLDLYRYACRNYDPNSAAPGNSDIKDPGDHIYGFGFSRGAFTMRILFGLIADQGLIPFTTERELEEKSRIAWKLYRRSRRSRLFRLILGDPKSGPAARLPGRDDTGYDSSEHPRPVLRFIGVWDTVAAYGGPSVEITRAIDAFFTQLTMPNYRLSPYVRRARHALSLNDERDSFWPLLWDEFAESDISADLPHGGKATWLVPDRLRQVWFAGVHADVGGGYPDESLSYVSLLWMIEEAHACGLRTIDEITERYRLLANSFGPIHDSRAGLQSYYRYQPRKLSAMMSPVEPSTLSLRDPLIAGPDGSSQGLIGAPLVHESIVARIASGTDGYAPIVLPGRFEIVPPGHLPESDPIETTGGDAAGAKAGKRNPGKSPLLDPSVQGHLTATVKQAVATAMERVWDLVWWRRIAYFLTVLATVMLLALPWWIPRSIHSLAGSAGADIASWPWLEVVREILGNLLQMVGGLLPDFLDRWVDAWIGSPFWFLFFVTAIVLLMRAGRRLEQRIGDEARVIWHRAIPRIPPATAGEPPAGVVVGAPSGLQRMRNSRAYQRSFQLVKWRALPLMIGAVLWALVLWLFLSVSTQLLLPFLEARDTLCARDGDGPHLTAGANFSTDRLCNRTGVAVTAGKRYVVDIVTDGKWRDGEYKTDPRGLSAGDMRWGVGYLGVPLRRVLGARYLQPVAAVREKVWVTFSPLEFQPVPGHTDRYQAEFAAPATGVLRLFSNDAIFLFDPEFFYRGEAGKNRGAACVEVRPAGGEGEPVPPPAC